jgi:CHASE3 domain sensor protein
MVVVSVVWVVYRTVEQAQVSDQSVLHTQEVLTSLEAVLATVLDADVAVRRFTTSSDSRTLEPFDRAERAAGEDINQLATLIADNPNQQARVPELGQAIARARGASRRRGREAGGPAVGQEH